MLLDWKRKLGRFLSVSSHLDLDGISNVVQRRVGSEKLDFCLGILPWTLIYSANIARASLDISLRITACQSGQQSRSSSI